MEKFGIFELLDALSAIVAPEKETEEPAPAQSGEQETFSPAPTAPPTANTSAYSPVDSLLKRHDEISRKIDGQKPQ